MRVMFYDIICKKKSDCKLHLKDSFPLSFSIFLLMSAISPLSTKQWMSHGTSVGCEIAVRCSCSRWCGSACGGEDLCRPAAGASWAMSTTLMSGAACLQPVAVRAYTGFARRWPWPAVSTYYIVVFLCGLHDTLSIVMFNIHVHSHRPLVETNISNYQPSHPFLLQHRMVRKINNLDTL